MKLLTIIGGMVMDETFRHAMLNEDPVETALDYGFQLTNQEGEYLTGIITGPERAQLEAALLALQNLWCPIRPCPNGFAMSQRREVYAKRSIAA